MAIRALYVTSEAYPLAKTGGLADVSAALPAALRELGIDIRLILPAYPQALARAPYLKAVAHLGEVPGCGDGRLLETVLPSTEVPAWLVDRPNLYNRDGGLYQSAEGSDWPDNASRFAALNAAAATIAGGLFGDWRPDIVHVNDWHAGLLPLVLSQYPEDRPPTILTIHNLAYQGVFDLEQFARLGLPLHLLPSVEFYGRISFLKAGIQAADAITTVSPTYAKEILTPECGCGLEGLLRERAPILRGILNGADYEIWDPRTDPALPANYSARAMTGKASCKRALQSELGLDSSGDAPLMVFMSRLAHQKMPDIVAESLPALIEEGMQFALVAEGDPAYEAVFRTLAESYRGRVSVRFAYEEPLGHRLLAGADMLAHPARFEPCGLVPIYAQRYGALPIVRHSGGMADSVVDATADTIQAGTATGFAFQNPTRVEFESCVHRALTLYRQPIVWRKLQASAMAQDFGWQRSAETYAQLYRSLTGESMGGKVAEPTRIKLFA
jgi:starch synthase